MRCDAVASPSKQSETVSLSRILCPNLKTGSPYTTVESIMRAMVTNHLIAFTSPEHPDAFRILLEVDTPDVALARLNAESIAPIIIYLTKEVEVTPKTKQAWLNFVTKHKPLRPGSQWRLIDVDMLNIILATHPDQCHSDPVEPPPFLEHMPTDEGRSQSMEFETKELRDSESEDDEGVTAPAGIKIPVGATWRGPTRKGRYSRNLWECFTDGTRIWHARPAFACHLSETGVTHSTGWYGRYDASSNSIIGDADGKKYMTISAFADAHYELHGREKQSGWATCKYLSNGEWKDVGTIKPGA